MRKVLLTVAAVMMFAVPAMADNCATGTYNFGQGCIKPTPEQGIELLKQGNASYVKGELSQLVVNSKAAERIEVAAGQKPFAVVLTCSDSRLPAEIIFNKGLGEIFVVRVAGNIVAPHELGSIEYALEHLHSNLVVVLGHSKCGAVNATIDAIKDPAKYPAGTNVASLVDDITLNIKETVDAGHSSEECIIENIKKVSESLEAKSWIIKEAVEKGETKIVRAKYDLNSGVVEFLSE